VYQIAAPLKNIIVVSVTRKDGMSNTMVQTPFMTPIAGQDYQDHGIQRHRPRPCAAAQGGTTCNNQRHQ
jgi:hypothetical protein